jgi:DNA-binding GntR family transcriptional regulator
VVEITPFRGARVRRPPAKEILEAYAVREELEVLATRLALGRLTDQDLEVLQEYFEEMQQAARTGDAHGVALADAAFHARIVELSGNGALDRVWHSLEPFSRTLITLILPGADPQWTADLHGPILEALRRRDQGLATAAIRGHFRDAERMAGRLWQDSEARDSGRSPSITQRSR